MQGVVFTFRNRGRKPRIRRAGDFVPMLKKWGIVAFFTAAIVAGLCRGCVRADKLSPSTIKTLDAFFLINLPERLSAGAFSAFSASFGSDFLFLLCAFLLGLSLWGAAILPFLAFLKGYSVGVSAGYLVACYGLSGLGFYLCVMLPGIIIFSLAFVFELASAFNIFRSLLASLFSKSQRVFKPPFSAFLKNSLKFFAVSFGASVVDALLWLGLAGAFGMK